MGESESPVGDELRREKPKNGFSLLIILDIVHNFNFCTEFI